MQDCSAWILVLTGIQSQNRYGRQDITEAVVTSNMSGFHIQVEHVNHRKTHLKKISILQSVILNVNFLLQLFNSALSVSVFLHQGGS